MLPLTLIINNMIKFKFGAMVALAMVIAISCENELQESVNIEEGVIDIQEAKLKIGFRKTTEYLKI